MPSELAKAYDPATVQSEVAAVWTDERCFHAEPADPGEPYSIVIPPPNVTAALHLGHALNNTLQDILVRRARMQGRNAVWLPGTDHAGIATQTVVEKRVLKEEGKRRTDFDRDTFIARIQLWKDEYERVILGQLQAMGCSCDWDRTAFTMDEPRARAVREAFFQLFQQGLIYRGKRLVNWDPLTQTALADDEVEMEEVDGHFYYLRYPLSDGSGHVTVATTRPETMLGDTAVAINPTDPRAAALKGKFVRLPIVNRLIPIIEDEYVVKPVSLGGDPSDVKAQMATGFLKVTPAHDPNDYEIGIRHQLPIVNVFSPTATISRDHGWPSEEWMSGSGNAAQSLLGLDRYEARKAVVEWFRQANLLEDVKPYRHSVGHSYRSHVPVEPYLSDQWYCRVTDPRLAGAALASMNPSQRSDAGSTAPVGTLLERPLPPARGSSEAPQPLPPARGSSHADDSSDSLDTLTFHPERYAKTFQTWHENIRDWCISRQLWWGHRIPVWRLRFGRLGERLSPTAHELILEQAKKWSLEGRIAIQYRGEIVAALPSDQNDPHLPFGFICVRDPDNDRDIVHALHSLGYEQDPDVLDTWFSSGLWPLSTLGWPDDTDELETWNPTSVLCTAREIITLWVSRMVMFNQFFAGRLPFTDVFIHAMIQDGEGRKMSKSLGNGVDPLDIIATHGTDALRFTLASMATNTQDVRMPVVRDPATGRNGSPKFDMGRNFCNKLWNAARFVLMSIQAVPPEPVDELKWTMADRWIVSRFNRTMEEANDALAHYRFDQYAKACYDFFWRDFCDWYVECAKVQLKSDATRGQTANVLASTLDAALRLLHPAVPFVTERLWWSLNELRPRRGIPGRIACPQPEDGARFTRVIKAPWPSVGDVSQAAEFIFPRIQDVIAAIRTIRSDYKVDARRVVSVSIRAPGDAGRQIELLRGQIELLGTCRLGAVAADVAEPTHCAKAMAAGCEIFVEGLVDESAEQQRVARRRDELTRQIDAMRKRLGNEGYVAKAPPDLVRQTKDQLAAAEAELAKLGG